MSEFYDLKDAMTEISAALKPLQSLADSLRGLDKAHRLQADLQLLEVCDSAPKRQEAFAKLDAAFNADAEAQATMLLCRKRGSDQRTFEQYAQAHGEANAKRAFTTEEDLQDLLEVAENEIQVLRAAYPVHFRVFTQFRKG